MWLTRMPNAVIGRDDNNRKDAKGKLRKSIVPVVSWISL